MPLISSRSNFWRTHRSRRPNLIFLPHHRNQSRTFTGSFEICRSRQGGGVRVKRSPFVRTARSCSTSGWQRSSLRTAQGGKSKQRLLLSGQNVSGACALWQGGPATRARATRHRSMLPGLAAAVVQVRQPLQPEATGVAAEVGTQGPHEGGRDNQRSIRQGSRSHHGSCRHVRCLG
jgi:hypothetical protein